MKNIFALLLLLFAASTAFGQDEPATTEEEANKPLAEEVAADIRSRIESINEQERVLNSLIKHSTDVEGMEASLYKARVDVVWADLFENTVGLANLLAGLRNDGFDISEYVDDAVRDLNELPEQAIEALDRLRETVSFSSPEQTPAEIAIRDQRLLGDTQKIDSIYQSLITYISLVEEYGIENNTDVDFLAAELEESAANRSSFLHIAIEQREILAKAAATLPADTDVKAMLAVTKARVQVASVALQNIVTLMNQMDLETAHYSRQVVTLTGELTSEVLNISVMADLAKEWSELVTKLAKTQGPKVLFSLLLFMIILFIFWHLSRGVQSLTKSALAASKIQVSALLSEMIVSAVRNLIMIFGILIALAQLGISLGPLLAGLGIAGFIIGFALQDTLSNFASGMLILLYRPFDVGDFVTAGGVTGKVSHMSLVNTTFKTIDNQVLVVPNNMIWSGVITNITAQRLRRVDLVIGVDYSDDVQKVETVLTDILESHELCLENPEPVVRLHELAESSVNFVVRPWVKTDDYWDVYWDLLREIKVRFDREGITIPFPQRTIHSQAD